jgi:uncharacterized protein (TIGR02246 family)
MRRFAICAVVAAVAAVAAVGLGGGLRAQSQTKDEQEIRALENQFAAAFNAKDVDAIMKFYVPGNELFVFDVGVPRQHIGWEDYKKDWQEFLAMVPGPLKFDISELSVTTDGKLGFSHSIQHLVWKGTDGSPMEMTVRATDVYRKIDGRWLIVQEHVSVPVDLTTDKADMMSKP